MASWQWNQQQNRAYLTCSLLRDWPHGFFTKQFWPQSPEQLTPLLATGATAYRIKQVHGNQVLGTHQVAPASATDASAADTGTGTIELSPRPEADGLLSAGKEEALWICSADCNPVLMGDRRTGRVAAVHAGWRGTAQHIVTVTVEKLLALGSCIEDLVVAIGPAIAGEVYQVSTQVGIEVGLTVYDTPGKMSDAELIEAMMALEASPLLPDPAPGRVRLDVRRVNVLQLERLGLAKEQIAVAPHCTFQEPENFFSYRRTHEKQVQWSGIVSR
jgi:YfiH family protein